jgi:hypothetical protein
VKLAEGRRSHDAALTEGVGWGIVAERPCLEVKDKVTEPRGFAVASVRTWVWATKGGCEQGSALIVDEAKGEARRCTVGPEEKHEDGGGEDGEVEGVREGGDVGRVMVVCELIIDPQPNSRGGVDFGVDVRGCEGAEQGAIEGAARG